jgi:hypothetical protein
VALVALAVLFFGPLLVATILFEFSDRWRPEGVSAEGELITPAVPLRDFASTSADGVVDPSFFRGRWTLLHVEETCNLACEAALFKTRQIRLTLGRDTDRVQRLLVVPGDVTPDAELLARHPDLAVARGGDLRPLLENLGPRVPGAFFIVDPMGNLMMRYPSDAPAKGLQKDLKHLLKVSKIG